MVQVNPKNPRLGPGFCGRILLGPNACFTSDDVYSPPEVDRIWLRVHYNKIPIYPIFYLLQGDYRHMYIAA